MRLRISLEIKLERKAKDDDAQPEGSYTESNIRQQPSFVGFRQAGDGEFTEDGRRR